MIKSILLSYIIDQCINNVFKYDPLKCKLVEHYDNGNLLYVVIGDVQLIYNPDRPDNIGHYMGNGIGCELLGEYHDKYFIPEYIDKYTYGDDLYIIAIDKYKSRTVTKTIDLNYNSWDEVSAYMTRHYARIVL